MRYVSSLFVMLLALGLVTGCEDPAKDAPEATVGEAAEIVEESAPEIPAEEESPGEPEMAEETAEEAPAEQAIAAETAAQPEVVTYTMSPEETYIGFAGSKATGTHYGQFPVFDGRIVVPDGDKFENAKIEITIDTTELTTDNSILTGQLKKEEFFNVEEYPEAKFVSTGVEKTDDGFQVTGNFTLRGQTKSISFPAQMRVEGETLIGEAEFSINRKDWGMEVSQWQGDTIIRDNVLIMLEIYGVPERLE